jgi:tetratricopeptide (TPR) repeat protein
MTIPDTAQQRLAHARVVASVALLELGDFDRAVAEAAEAHSLESEPARNPYAQALIARGSALLRDGNPTAANADFRAALALAPAPYLAVVADALLVHVHASGKPQQATGTTPVGAFPVAPIPEPAPVVANPPPEAPAPAVSEPVVAIPEPTADPAVIEQTNRPEPVQPELAPVSIFPSPATELAQSDQALEPVWAERLLIAAQRDPIIGVALAPGADRLAVASNDQNVRVFSSSDGTLLATLLGHSSRVWCVDFLDAENLISASLDRTVRIWSAAGGEPLQTFRGHTDGIWCMALADDCSLVATGSSDRTARVWQVVDGRELQTFKAHDGSVAAVALSPSKEHVATGARDGLIRIWDRQQAARPLAKIRTSTSRIEHLAFAPDQPLLAAAVGSAIWLIDRERWEVQERLIGHTNQVTALEFAPGLDLLASASADGSVRFWRVSTGAVLDSFMIAPNGVAGMALAPSGDSFAATIADKTIRFWVLAPPDPDPIDPTDPDAPEV